MEELNIPAKKIISVGKTAMDEYDLKHVTEVPFDLLVYSYETGSYDGSGIAVGKMGDKYFYHEMGHCSCNGPMEGFTTSANALHTLEEVEELVKKNYNYGDHAEKVIAEVKKHI